jgi:hypothetical protein
MYIYRFDRQTKIVHLITFICPHVLAKNFSCYVKAYTTIFAKFC